MPSFIITEFDEIPSTNTWAKEHVGSFAKGSFQVILAKKQSGGRGRQGRSFVSLQGGLYLSCAFEVPGGHKDLSALAIALGAQLANYLGVSLKWPNDLVFKGKKLGGFLIEATGVWWIVGLGVNVNSSEEGRRAHRALDIETLFLDEIDDRRAHFMGKKLDIHSLKEEVAQIIYETKEMFLEKGLSPFMPAIEKSLSHRKGDKIFIRIGNKIKIPAIFQGISDKGELLITRIEEEGLRPVERISQAEIIE